MKDKASEPVAYALWGICIFGLCGFHRLYTGRYKSGLLYLFTFGLLYIGQFTDFEQIPRMVKQYNKKLSSYSFNPNPVIQSRVSEIYKDNHMSELLRYAKLRGGTLTPAEIALTTKKPPEFNKVLIDEAMRHGFCEIFNDPETGKIRYRFDV